LLGFVQTVRPARSKRFTWSRIVDSAMHAHPGDPAARIIAEKVAERFAIGRE
jgi:hypothetical protein